MPEFKGTPGPWRIVRNEFEDYCSTEYCELAIKGIDGEMNLVVAGVVSDCIDEHKANANLIAAAPELLQALIQMIATYPYSPPCHGWEAQVQAHKRAKEAIQKALGK